MKKRPGKPTPDRRSSPQPTGCSFRAAPPSPTRAQLQSEVNQLHEELALERQLKADELEAMRELEASRQHYADLYDSAPIGYADFGTTGILRSINLTGSRLLAQDREDLLDRPLLPLIAKPDRRNWLRHVASLRRQPFAIVELAMALPAGQPLVLRFHSVRMAPGEFDRSLHATLRSAFIDITAQRQAEGLAEQRQAELEDLYRNAPVGLGMLDTDLRYLRVNQRLAEIHGLPVAAHHGRSVREILPGQAEQLEPSMRDVIDTGRPRIGLEITCETPAQPGIARNLLANWLPIRDSTRRIIGLSAMVEDITERKRAEAALREAKEAAESANRAKDDFLATLSHELRTPLTPVLILSQQLERTEDLPAEVREDLKTIRQNVQLEARLIDDLLDLTRIARGKIQLRPEPVDVHQLLRQAVKTCREGNSLSQGLGIEWQLEATSSFVRADPTRMEQVFWNLINNAIKFTQPAGTITIQTANAPLPERPCPQAPAVPSGPRTIPDTISIRIVDTGIGIDPGKLTTIFNSFEQGGTKTTARYGGLGLGLAIAKAVIELHGGTIAAASQGPGQGAAFTVTLKTVCAPKPTAVPPASGPASPESGKDGHPLRILVVEDHPPTALLLQRVFQHCGWHTHHAATVRAALDLAARESFDLVVSDLGLPDGNGHELMQQLHEHYGLSGIALSGYGMEQDTQKSLASGFSLHLTKPVNLDELRSAVANLGAQSPHHEPHLTPV